MKKILLVASLLLACSTQAQNLYYGNFNGGYFTGTNVVVTNSATPGTNVVIGGGNVTATGTFTGNGAGLTNIPNSSGGVLTNALLQFSLGYTNFYTQYVTNSTSTNNILVSYMSLDGTMSTCGWSNVVKGATPYVTLWSGNPSDTNKVSVTIFQSGL